MRPRDHDVAAVVHFDPPGSEKDSLDAIVKEGLEKGFLFLSDADARPEYASDPKPSTCGTN